MIPSAEDLLASLAGYTRATTDDSSDRPIRLGTVDPAYVSGAPKVLLDGDTVMSAKGFKVINGWTPLAGSRVALAPVADSYVVMGYVGDPGASASTLASGVWKSATVGVGSIPAATGSHALSTFTMSVADGPVIGLTNTGGTVTIGPGQGGTYTLEAKYDVAMSLGGTQRFDCWFGNPTNTQEYGGDAKFYPASGYSYHTWSTTTRLAEGAQVKPFAKCWVASGSANYTNNSEIGLGRTWFKVIRIS